jgi:hypothetical protein
VSPTSWSPFTNEWGLHVIQQQKQSLMTSFEMPNVRPATINTFFSFFWLWYTHNWNNSRITLLQALWLVICTLLDWSPQLDSKIKSFMNNKTTSVC